METIETIYSARDMVITIALFLIAFAIAGGTALAIFWPLTHVHLRDRHPAWRETHLQRDNVWLWFLFGRFSKLGDASLSGLARPLQIALWVIISGLLGGWILWLLSEYVFK